MQWFCANDKRNKKEIQRSSGILGLFCVAGTSFASNGRKTTKPNLKLSDKFEIESQKGKQNAEDKFRTATKSRDFWGGWRKCSWRGGVINKPCQGGEGNKGINPWHKKNGVKSTKKIARKGPERPMALKGRWPWKRLQIPKMAELV